MKNLFELKENYSVETVCTTPIRVRSIYEKCTILEAMQICEDFVEKHQYGEVRLTSRITGEILYERIATEGKSANYTHISIYNAFSID